MNHYCIFPSIYVTKIFKSLTDLGQYTTVDNINYKSVVHMLTMFVQAIISDFLHQRGSLVSLYNKISFVILDGTLFKS